MPLPPLIDTVRRRFGGLAPAARAGIAAAVLLPLFAFAAIDFGAEDADDTRTAATPPAGGADTFLKSASAVLPQDLDDELERLRDAGPAANAAVDPVFAAKAMELMESLPKDADGNPDWARVDMDDYARRVQALGDPAAATGAAPAAPLEIEDLDLDDALEIVAGRIDAENPQTLDTLRDSPQADEPATLLAHASVLMLAGDPWGAAANLLVAHEHDEDDASPLVDLAAIANGQQLPSVALALLAAAGERTIVADDSPAGIAEQAALLNNRGHALLLLRRYEEAEAPLRSALATSPELSEAARNLAHALLKLGRDDEARLLMPRAVWRVRGDAAKPVPVQDAAGAPPPDAPPPAGSPEAIARWVRAPWLESQHGSTRVPLWIALDLSKQGQVAWPEPLYPVADATYGSWFERASSRYVAAHEAAAAFGAQAGASVTAGVSRRMTRGDHVNQAIEVMISPLWSLEPIDREMHRLDSPGKESLVLGSGQPTRFAALDVAREEFRMELAADRLYERFRRDSRCPAGSTTDECCAIARREIDRNLAEMTPIVRDYEDEMRVFFRDAYGLSTAIASNLPAGRWHDAARSTIEQQVQLVHWRTQQEIAFAFAHAAPAGSACYDEVDVAAEAAPDVKVDAPACSAAAQWASGKYAFSDNFSMELTCGKLKFVAEVNVIGTKKLNWGPMSDVGADLGMHAEVEFSMEGTMTIFAGPKAGVSGKIGGVGGDFGVKDGIYAVIGADGVRDVGMRVVIGGGVGAGSTGGTHDVDSMDFSFVSAI